MRSFFRLLARFQIPILVLMVVFSSGSAWHGFASGSENSRKLGSFVRSVMGQVGVTVGYDPAYVKIAYPGGDVPIETGVCTDVVIRGMRAAGTDLQQEVHMDMKRNFSLYPKNWGLSRPDTNIDHRRVPNLMCFFRRRGYERPVSAEPGSYLPGDVVTWRLPNGMNHIGVVVETEIPDTGRRLVVHNIGLGARLEDILFTFPITGHYRPFPISTAEPSSKSGKGVDPTK